MPQPFLHHVQRDAPGHRLHSEAEPQALVVGVEAVRDAGGGDHLQPPAGSPSYGPTATAVARLGRCRRAISSDAHASMARRVHTGAYERAVGAGKGDPASGPSAAPEPRPVDLVAPDLSSGVPKR